MKQGYRKAKNLQTDDTPNRQGQFSEVLKKDVVQFVRIAFKLYIETALYMRFYFVLCFIENLFQSSNSNNSNF